MILTGDLEISRAGDLEIRMVRISGMSRFFKQKTAY
eukprot:COSAG01_NODE_62071_length_286_cov_0.967914_1_plen_35_part_01